MGAPWFKLYAKDYLGDPKVRMLSDADRGILVDLWAIQTSFGNIPKDAVALGKLLNKRPDHASKALSRLSCFLVDDPFDTAFKVSIRLRQEQEAYSKKVEANQANGIKGGRPKKNPLGFLNETHHGNPNVTEPEPELEKDIIKSAKRTKAKKSEPRKEGLKEILEWDGMDWSSVFFEIFKCFPRDRVINRITLAKQFRDAVRLDGATPEQIYQSALDLSKSREPRYMPDAARWMAEQGWRAYEVGDAAQV